MSITLSHSSAKKFCRCKRAYKYSIIDGIELRLQDPKLKAGNWFHQLSNLHYSGKNWRKEHARLTKQFNNLFLEEREWYGDLPGMVQRMMESYLWKYEKEDQDWEVLAVEQTFRITFRDGDIFTFKPDLIIRDHSRDTGDIWVVDHKTVRSMPSGDWRLEDLQSTLYPWALDGHEIIGGEEVKGFIFNYVRRKAPTVPKYTKTGRISRARIDTDFPTYARFMLQHYEVQSVNDRTLREENKFMKRSRLIKPQALVERQIQEFQIVAQEIETWHELHEASPGEDVWVRTMIPSCSWDCDYEALCMVELLGQDSTFMRRAKYQPSEYTKERNLGR
jgi:hypothetical protein